MIWSPGTPDGQHDDECDIVIGDGRHGRNDGALAMADQADLCRIDSGRVLRKRTPASRRRRSRRWLLLRSLRWTCRRRAVARRTTIPCASVIRQNKKGLVPEQAFIAVVRP